MLQGRAAARGERMWGAGAHRSSTLGPGKMLPVYCPAPHPPGSRADASSPAGGAAQLGFAFLATVPGAPMPLSHASTCKR